MHSLLWLGIVLVVLWLVLRFVFAVAGFFFNLLWIAALIMIALWLWRKFVH